VRQFRGRRLRRRQQPPGLQQQLELKLQQQFQFQLEQLQLK
jgi:hypothetical protein